MKHDKLTVEEALEQEARNKYMEKKGIKLDTDTPEEARAKMIKKKAEATHK